MFASLKESNLRKGNSIKFIAINGPFRDEQNQIARSHSCVDELWSFREYLEKQDRLTGLCICEFAHLWACNLIIGSHAIHFYLYSWHWKWKLSITSLLCLEGKHVVTTNHKLPITWWWKRYGLDAYSNSSSSNHPIWLKVIFWCRHLGGNNSGEVAWSLELLRKRFRMDSWNSNSSAIVFFGKFKSLMILRKAHVLYPSSSIDELAIVGPINLVLEEYHPVVLCHLKRNVKDCPAFAEVVILYNLYMKYTVIVHSTYIRWLNQCWRENIQFKGIWMQMLPSPKRGCGSCSSLHNGLGTFADRGASEPLLQSPSCGCRNRYCERQLSLYLRKVGEDNSRAASHVKPYERRGFSPAHFS